jgi:hypothetical protein
VNRAPDKGPIIHSTPIATVCLHILGKMNLKKMQPPPWAGNRTENRKHNCLCRRPLAVYTYVYDSAHKSPNDSVQDLLAKGLGF